VNRWDLVVGAELYYALPSDWQAHRPGCKAVVLSVDHHGSKIYGWGRVFLPNPRGGRYGGVLAELREDGKPPRTAVVQLGNLRGPYAEVAAQVAVGTATKAARIRLREAQ